MFKGEFLLSGKLNLGIGSLPGRWYRKDVLPCPSKKLLEPVKEIHDPVVDGFVFLSLVHYYLLFC